MLYKRHTVDLKTHIDSKKTEKDILFKQKPKQIGFGFFPHRIDFQTTTVTRDEKEYL